MTPQLLLYSLIFTYYTKKLVAAERAIQENHNPQAVDRTWASVSLSLTEVILYVSKVRVGSFGDYMRPSCLCSVALMRLFLQTYMIQSREVSKVLLGCAPPYGSKLPEDTGEVSYS